MCCPRWALLLLCCIVDLTSSRPIPDDRSAEASVEETRHRRQIFFGGPPPFGPPRMGPLPPQPFPPPPFGYHGHLMRPPYFPPPLPPVVPPIGPMPAPVMMPPPQPMPTIVFGPQQLEPLEPEEPAPLPQPIPRPRPTPAPRPPRPTFSSSTFLSHPEVKKFIAEISRHTTAFNKPNQGYDRVLLLMQRYFTRRSRTRTEYDGTLIRPTIFGSNDELVANRKITGNLFENDMALTVPQMLIASRSPGGRYRRKIIADSTHHWRGARIPYYFGSADRSWQQRIRNALDYFERETCLRFVEDSRAEDFIYFLRGSGCFSAIGKLGGSQPISIGTGCESYAIPGTEGNFDKRPPGALIDLGIPYDLGSVMHYASTAFAYESLRHTVDPVDTKYRSTVGNRVAPSFTDIKQINHLYCSDRCTTTVNTCQNGGYPDPNNCTRCKCPQGLAGSTCTDLEYAICGGELQATFSWQELNHSVSGQCYWRISAVLLYTYPGGRVRFQVTDVFFKCGPTCEEFIEIKYLADMQVTGFRLCCYPEGGTILSRGPYILVIIRAVAPSRFALRYISGHINIGLKAYNDQGLMTSALQKVVQKSRYLLTNRLKVFGETGMHGVNVPSGVVHAEFDCGVAHVQEDFASEFLLLGIQDAILKQQQFETQSQQCNMRACEPGATLRLARTGRVLRRGLRRSINDHASEWCCERFLASAPIMKLLCLIISTVNAQYAVPFANGGVGGGYGGGGPPCSAQYPSPRPLCPPRPPPCPIPQPCPPQFCPPPPICPPPPPPPPPSCPPVECSRPCPSVEPPYYPVRPGGGYPVGGPYPLPAGQPSPIPYFSRLPEVQVFTPYQTVAPISVKELGYHNGRAGQAILTVEEKRKGEVTPYSPLVTVPSDEESKQGTPQAPEEETPEGIPIRGEAGPLVTSAEGAPYTEEGSHQTLIPPASSVDGNGGGFATLPQTGPLPYGIQASSATMTWPGQYGGFQGQQFGRGDVWSGYEGVSSGNWGGRGSYSPYSQAQVCPNLFFYFEKPLF
ncbi:unnamed protein product [Toxocara canis]|uniref:ZnMc domain-containing protein n=1 Tax=Toxocara canis TaxID=6265 RepID=A0A183UZX0_TOXCA|nr:unnamed protein product [Toxocara canis]